MRYPTRHRAAAVVRSAAALGALSLWIAGTMAVTPAVDPLVAAGKEPGAVVTPSGMVYRSLREGKGVSPTPADVVKVHYRGTLPNGKEFDSSYKRNEPASFPLGGVIRCWTEGLQHMKVGGKAKLTCPSALAYGPRAVGPDIPANATLLFDVELLGIGPS